VGVSGRVRVRERERVENFEVRYSHRSNSSLLH
jgi:hypothetical protein